MNAIATTTVYCRRCKASFQAPVLSASEQSRIAELARTGELMAAARLLQQSYGMELGDGKAVEMHITKKPRFCNRCTRQLPSSGQLECPNCGGLNFDW